MATKKSGFSLAVSAQVATSTLGFGSGRAKVVKAKWGVVKYSGAAAGRKATALILTLARGGEKLPENYTLGKGFKPSEDGKQLVPTDNQAGLNPTSKCGLLFSSLAKSAQMPDSFDLDTDIGVLVGLDIDFVKKPMEKGEGMTGNPTVLVMDPEGEVYSAPWKFKKGAGKKKDEDADDDDEEASSKKADADDEDDEDEDEAPKKKKRKPDPDEDEDEDEPAPKKKKRVVEDEDEDEDEAPRRRRR